MSLNPEINLLPIETRSFYEPVTHCEIKELTIRIGTAVANFFRVIIVAICDFIVAVGNALCEEDELSLSAYRGAPFDRGFALFEESPMADVQEKAPTEAVARERRNAALARLKQIRVKTQFIAPSEILTFDLDTAIQKYGTNQSPTKLLEWYDYASADESVREEVKVMLQLCKYNTGTRAKTIQNLASKLHYILLEKKAHIDTLPVNKKLAAEKAFVLEIRQIFVRLLDTRSNCINQVLSQVEDIIVEVIASGNSLNKTSVVSSLQNKAAHVLFRHRTRLIKEILTQDENLSDPEHVVHMADIERVVKQRLAKVLGLNGEIIEAGAQFAFLVQAQASAAAKEARPIFDKRYNPVEYLQEQCRVIWGNEKGLRNALLQWATMYYGLDGEDELSKAVVKSREDLECAMSIAGVDLTVPGMQLFLEAAGIIQKNK